MTCNVAVLNRLGVALATDSAVSSLRHDESGEVVTKVFWGSRKLFRLRPDLPVGILLHGSTDLMGRPWESLIGTFRSTLPARGFPALVDYARAFFRHVESDPALFPDTLQRRDFRLTCEAYVKGFLLHGLEEELDEPAADDPEAARQALGRILKRDLEEWKRVPELEGLGEPYGQALWRHYGREIHPFWAEILGFRPSRSLVAGLDRLARHLYSRQWISPEDISGIVFAGFGEKEFFPAIAEYWLGTLALGRLRVIQRTSVAVSDENAALLFPFGQTEAIDAFFRGITPKLMENLGAAVREACPPGAAESLLEEFRKTIEQTQIEPLMCLISSMPCSELVRLAEMLVNLAVFGAHLSPHLETVGGPLELALLNRETAFTWVRRNRPTGIDSDLQTTPDNRRFS